MNYLVSAAAGVRERGAGAGLLRAPAGVRVPASRRPPSPRPERSLVRVK